MLKPEKSYQDDYMLIVSIMWLFNSKCNYINYYTLIMMFTYYTHAHNIAITDVPDVIYGQ